jgi:hypothetical protein
MTYFQDEACVKKIEEDFAQMLLVSKERTLANTKRSFLGRVFDTVLRIFEPLL